MTTTAARPVAPRTSVSSAPATAAVSPTPRGWVVPPSQIAGAFVVALLLLLPLDHLPYDVLNTAVLAGQDLIVAVSLVLLIGLVGQISLCQASLVGMGAFTTALSVHDLHLAFPFTLLVGTAAGALTACVIGAVALRVRGLFFAVATLIFAYVCDNYLFVQPWLVGSQSGTSITPGTVGTKGTVLFVQLADAHDFYYVALAAAGLAVYAVANLTGTPIGRAFHAVRGSEMAAVSLGIDVVRTKLVAFAIAGALAGFGGAITLSAASSINPTEFSFLQSLFFLSVAVVGGLRSIGGVVASSVLFAGLVGELFYRVPAAANYLDLISGMLLLVVLLFFRGGLGALPAAAKPVLLSGATRIARRRPAPPRPGRPLLLRAASAARIPAGIGLLARAGGAHLPKVRLPRPRRAADTRAAVDIRPEVDIRPAGEAPAVTQGRALDLISLAGVLNPARVPAPATAPPAERAPEPQAKTAGLDPTVLAARLGEVETIAGAATGDGRRGPLLVDATGITVRFGGLTAVDNASLKVGAGEIVGLIGPNGAGKTTLFNSILGLNDPVSGRVNLFGQDVTRWPVHRRAALGVGRTFQVLQLFPDLTVFDNLLAATWLEHRSNVFECLLGTTKARNRELAARAKVRAALELMGLSEFAHRRAGGLPFGVLRLVEVARALLTGAKLICLDEPASGLDSAETEKFIEWLQLLRRLGLTLLVIEHDVAMVTRLCDYIYVLDQGKPIGEGTPAQVRANQAVIDSYLGGATGAATGAAT